MPYWKLFYHIVTATKNRVPLLNPQIEPLIYAIMRHKIEGLDGCVYAINGFEDHVHFVVSIPPKIAVAEFIGQVKGSTSTIFNKDYPNCEPFYWQNAYSIFSFDEKRLQSVVRYVDLQKEHHARQTLILPLERLDDN